MNQLGHHSFMPHGLVLVFFLPPAGRDAIGNLISASSPICSPGRWAKVQ